ncbi:hypothetical protein B9Z55_002966 [Caenorhabditis nigoni]|uniref:DUF19 domain-containing protein n=1 Tax=Caenorhabditis nigoni TaxID=1611254 RepID=A0A2G5VMV2_9PELO|nr:hypothetical protein B9Z55_002966 [Caenorhabditis nigoni]
MLLTLSISILFLSIVSCKDKVIIADSSKGVLPTLNYLKHLNNFLKKLDPYPENFTLQYLPVCELTDEQGNFVAKLCSDSTELNVACTQKYIKGNFLPTILCFNEYPDTPTLEECVGRSIDCSEEAAEITSNIKKCVESNEGQNLMKKARKALPIANRTPNGFINKKAALFNKAPKEQLCGLKSLKSQEACQPCRRS